MICLQSARQEQNIGRAEGWGVLNNSFVVGIGDVGRSLHTPGIIKD